MTLHAESYVPGDVLRGGQRVSSPRRAKIIRVVGTVGKVTTDLKPEVDKIWVTQDVWFIHDDTSARACNWQWTDGQYIAALDANNVAANTTVPYNNSATALAQHSVTLTISRELWLQANCAAIDAAKKVTIYAVVFEFNFGEVVS